MLVEILAFIGSVNSDINMNMKLNMNMNIII